MLMGHEHMFDPRSCPVGELTGSATACIIVSCTRFTAPRCMATSNPGRERQVLMARRRSKAEVEELEDEEELDLEDLDDEADVEDEDVEEEDEDEDEEEAPRKKKSKSKAAAKKNKAQANGNIGSADLVEALGTDGRNLRVMLRAKGV